MEYLRRILFVDHVPLRAKEVRESSFFLCEMYEQNQREEEERKVAHCFHRVFFSMTKKTHRVFVHYNKNGLCQTPNVKTKSGRVPPYDYSETKERLASIHGRRDSILYSLTTDRHQNWRKDL